MDVIGFDFGNPEEEKAIVPERDIVAQFSAENLDRILATIPEDVLAEYGISKAKGEDTPEDADVKGAEYAEQLLSDNENENVRMIREGYTITDCADKYWFGHRKWSSRQGAKPIRIVIHHMAGNLTPAQFMAIMQSARQMSATVSIHSDGTVFAWDPEETRPWTTGNYAADQAALTIEAANDEIGGNWHLSDVVIDMIATICAEWCKRYNIDPVYSYRGAGLNMHKDWASTACPGPYLENLIKNGSMEKLIRAKMAGSETAEPEQGTEIIYYRVQVGAFKNVDNANRKLSSLLDKGIQGFIVNDGTYHRVQVGSFTNPDNAVALKQKLEILGEQTLMKIYSRKV